MQFWELNLKTKNSGCDLTCCHKCFRHRRTTSTLKCRPVLLFKVMRIALLSFISPNRTIADFSTCTAMYKVQPFFIAHYPSAQERQSFWHVVSCRSPISEPVKSSSKGVVTQNKMHLPIPWMGFQRLSCLNGMTFSSRSFYFHNLRNSSSCTSFTQATHFDSFHSSFPREVK